MIPAHQRPIHTSFLVHVTWKPRSLRRLSSFVIVNLALLESNLLPRRHPFVLFIPRCRATVGS